MKLEISNLPDTLTRFDCAYERHKNSWNCWAIIDNCWFRGKGANLQEALDDMMLCYSRGIHIGKLPKFERQETKKFGGVKPPDKLSELF